MAGGEFAALDTLQYGLARDAERAHCLAHWQEVLAGITVEAILEVFGEADTPRGVGCQLLAGNNAVIARRLPFCSGADPDRSAAESVDEMAQLKQIAKAAQSTRADVGFPARAHAATMTFVPVSPLGRDQRATAVGKAGQHEQNTAAPDTADDGERAALKRMALARDNY